MDAERRLTKALEAVNDALQHLSITLDFGSLDYTHIDRLLGRVVDLPTENNQRNSRRNLLIIRQWMVTESPSVAMLEVLGQVYWRLGELNSKQFEKFKETLQQQQPYLNLVKNGDAVRMVVQRIRFIQRSKVDACQDFLFELSERTAIKDDSSMNGIDVARTRTNSPYTPPQSVCSQDTNSSQEFSHASLTKCVQSSAVRDGEMEQILTDFYIDSICPGRTVSAQSNAYLSLLHVATTCSSTRYALLSLVASYIGDYNPSEKEAYHQAELYYSTQALQALTAQISNGENYDGALATSMLLMHHNAINQQGSPLCWSCHVNILEVIPSTQSTDPLSQPALFLRAQSILARTAQSSSTLQKVQTRPFETVDWLDGIPLATTCQISPELGLSPYLLSLISSLTHLATNPHTPKKVIDAQGLESHLVSLQQWTPEPQAKEREILVTTAEAFRLATLLYLRCRIYGFTPSHPSIFSLSSALEGILIALVAEDNSYSPVYPIWPFFVACVAAEAEGREMLCRSVGMVVGEGGGKRTLSAVLRWVSGIECEEMEGGKREGWWDDVMTTVGEGEGEGLLCLGSF